MTNLVKGDKTFDGKPHWILTETRRIDLLKRHSHIPPIPNTGTLYYRWDNMGAITTRWMPFEEKPKEELPKTKPVPKAFIEALAARRAEIAKS